MALLLVLLLALLLALLGLFVAFVSVVDVIGGFLIFIRALFSAALVSFLLSARASGPFSHLPVSVCIFVSAVSLFTPAPVPVSISAPVSQPVWLSVSAPAPRPVPAPAQIPVAPPVAVSGPGRPFLLSMLL